jgi:predicted dehydrogenase
MRFAMFGAGFWSTFQLAGWSELPDVHCVAVYNRTPAKARRLGVAAVYDDPSELLANEDVDFVDIVTNADTHGELASLAAQHRKPVICQKPLAPSLEHAERMADTFAAAGLPLYVNENWRWQTPIRRVRELLDDDRIGRPFRARIRMVSGFPVFDNQPFLKDFDQFLLVDIGTHILDVARFWFGEAESVACQVQRVQVGIRGEDVATVMLKMRSGTTVVCEMGYPGIPFEADPFPQTLAFLEGERGSMELRAGYEIRITTRAGTDVVDCAPRHYPWADPAYDVVHSSIVPCQANLLEGLRGICTPETTAEDNLRTLRLVFGAYDSARSGTVIRL